ncbi:MAG TPA: RimK/LysX family protein [Nocardioidaceae bacterium]
MTTDLSYTLAGWREWVSLPGIGVPWVKAKLDTGARTSAIHAFDIEEFAKGGDTWVRYSIHPWQRSDEGAVDVESKVEDLRTVRSSSGYAEERIVVMMDIRLMARTITAEVTLSRRDEMGFRMLVGREALRQGFVVDPSRSYVGRRPPRSTRRRNRGR